MMGEPPVRPLRHDEVHTVEYLTLYESLGEGNVETLARLIETAEDRGLHALLLAAVDPLVRQGIATIRGALKALGSETG